MIFYFSSGLFGTFEAISALDAQSNTTTWLFRQMKDRPKILHWPGLLRKPWQRSLPMARSGWDEDWWRLHQEMCEQARAAPCRLQCPESLKKMRFSLGRCDVDQFWCSWGLQQLLGKCILMFFGVCLMDVLSMFCVL